LETAWRRRSRTHDHRRWPSSNLLATVFPPTGLLRLVATNGNDAFYRRHADGQWLVLGQKLAGLDDFITASGGT
jgi:hypothetical protein